MSYPAFWLTIGFLGQALFTARFLVQWMASEKKRDAVVPVAFWWLSLLGGAALLAYAISRRDPVIVVGQSMGLFIYVRNLMLVDKARRRLEMPARRRSAVSRDAGPCEARESLHPSPLESFPAEFLELPLEHGVDLFIGHAALSAPSQTGARI